MARTDGQVKQDIEQELRWDPKLNAAQIGVSVDRGIVSLAGAVDTYAEKWRAEDAIKRVSGVRKVAQSLTVKVLTEHERTDADVAAATQMVLACNVFVPKTVSARVAKGWVTLEGRATWNYEREAAERAVAHLTGIAGVRNHISLEPVGAESHVSATAVEAEVEGVVQAAATAEAKASAVLKQIKRPMTN
jgi:osmotically-inducible protein OsmY